MPALLLVALLPRSKRGGQLRSWGGGASRGGVAPVSAEPFRIESPCRLGTLTRLGFWKTGCMRLFVPTAQFVRRYCSVSSAVGPAYALTLPCSNQLLVSDTESRNLG